MQEITFPVLMVKHHKHIESLLSAFKQEIGNTSDALRDALDEFESAVKKHFSTEEESIFKFADTSDQDLAILFKNLMTDHFTILGMIEPIRKAVESGAETDCSTLEILLNKHLMVEDQILYPRMERELSNEDKEQIIVSLCTLDRSPSIQDFK